MSPMSERVAPFWAPLSVLSFVLWVTAAMVVMVAIGPSAFAEDVPAPAQGVSAVDVDLVSLDLLVTDRSGRPILDLAPEEIRVFEDDRQVDLSHFQLPLGGADGGAPGSTAPSTGARGPTGPGHEPIQWVVLIDRVHVNIMGRNRLLTDLEPFLEALGPDDQVMVATFQGDVQILQPFTDSRRKIDRALKAAGEVTADQLSAGIEEQQGINVLLEVQQMEGAFSNGSGSGTCVSMGQNAEALAEIRHQRVEASIDALARFVNLLSSVDGRKNVLLVSDGIPLVPGADLLQYAIEMCDGTAAAQGVAYAIDVRANTAALRDDRWDPYRARLDMQKFNTAPQWQQLASAANLVDVSFYSVLTSGSAQPASAGESALQTATTRAGADKVASLGLLADVTGGAVLQNYRDFEPELMRALADSRSTYGLGYPPAPSTPGVEHMIRVEVDRPGVTVRHRKSYVTKTAEQRISERVLSNLFFGMESNPLGAEAQILAGQQPEGPPLVLRIKVPADRLAVLDGPSSQRGILSIYVAVRDEKGRTTPVRQKRLPFERGFGAGGADYVYEIGLPAQPGTFQVGLALQDELGAETSYLIADGPQS